MNFDISSIFDAVISSYNFTIDLKDITLENYGLYTMIACVYQVNKDSCGYDAWVEVQVFRRDEETFWKKYQLLFESGSPTFLIGIAAIAFILYCCVKGV